MTSQCVNHAFIIVILGAVPLNAQPVQPSASEHLQHALHLTDLNNWTGAEKDFAEAERIFAAAGDQRNALYARLGKIRATGGDRSPCCHICATGSRTGR
jgi:hypothetical protein